jgi:hypothetical protein
MKKWVPGNFPFRVRMSERVGPKDTFRSELVSGKVGYQDTAERA